MVGSDIKIDKEGIWYYCGQHMFRKDILCLFFENLHLDDCGKHFIELNGEICYVDVEDTAFVVNAVYRTRTQDEGHDRIEILLSDDSLEALDIESLFVGNGNVMYCRVKEGKFVARFTRKSYYQLAELIEVDDTGDHYYITLNQQKYFINHN